MTYPSLPGYIFSRTYIFRRGNASPVLTIYNSSYRRGRGVVKPKIKLMGPSTFRFYVSTACAGTQPSTKTEMRISIYLRNFVYVTQLYAEWLEKIILYFISKYFCSVLFELSMRTSLIGVNGRFIRIGNKNLSNFNFINIYVDSKVCNSRI